jgi:nucleoside-diphosphate-sugar epimerase
MARIFLAGASGLIGQQLVKLLVRAGHEVTGTTRTESRTGPLRALGATPVLVDAFDREALGRVVLASRPEIVLHQLTSLPDDLSSLDGADLERALRENARMRTEGTANLVAAASVSGARRLVAQSILWIYAPGPEPHLESDPVNIEAQGLAAVTIRGVVANERAVLGAPMEAVVLRNGWLYGPGTGQDTARKDPAVHVDAAARAAFLAVERGSGVYNVADPGKYASSEKARRELGWEAAFRL